MVFTSVIEGFSIELSLGLGGLCAKAAVVVRANRETRIRVRCFRHRHIMGVSAAASFLLSWVIGRRS